MSRTTKLWIGGIISSIAGGAIAVLGTTVADPEHFSPSVGDPRKIWTVIAFAAGAHVLNYLVHKPLPDVVEANGDGNDKANGAAAGGA